MSILGRDQTTMRTLRPARKRGRMPSLSGIRRMFSAAESSVRTNKHQIAGSSAWFGLTISIAAVITAVVGCEELPTVSGPESNALASKATGVIVTGEQTGHGLTGLAIFHLPSLKKTSLVPVTAGSDQIITKVSGPDEDETIAYVHATLDKHYLKTINLDGTKDQIIFERPGGFTETGIADLAIAPKGSRVAFLNNGDTQNGVQMQNPPTFLSLGSLEIWDIDKKAALKLPPITAVSSWSTPFLSWFPDGQKIAYVELVPKGQVTLPRSDLDEFVKSYPGWDRVPVVSVLDIRTGHKEVIHSGFAPVVSSDGTQILAQFSRQWMVVVDVTGRGSRPISLPGAYSFALAIPNHNLFLYWGLPTQGAAPTYSPYGSFRAGLQMVSLKLADLDAGSFQTVVYPIDPRDSTSFGRDQPAK